MTAEHKYEMTISLQIVEHLGLNLYSNTSAVISEAVANKLYPVEWTPAV